MSRDNQSESEMIKILFLAANPKDTDALRLGEEIRQIKERLRLADLRDEFVVEQEWAVRVTDLQGHLLRHRPHIVHFSGHGSKSGQVVLEDQSGNSKPVRSDALKRLFATLKDNVRCVILNACYSEAQAKEIVESIDCVVGMTQAIPDESAILFAASFYQALGYGQNIQKAFDLGCMQIQLPGDGRAAGPALDDRPGHELGAGGATSHQDDIPKLKFAVGVDPATIYFSANSREASVVHPAGGTSTPAGPTEAILASASEAENPARHSSLTSLCAETEEFTERRNSRSRADADSHELSVPIRTDPSPLTAPSQPHIDLFLPNGCWIRVTRGFDEHTLRRLIAVAEQRSCLD